MGRVEGKVAFITGAARGQGRSHAVRLAQEGADIIAIDLCGGVATVPYQLATADDLAQTVKAVKQTGRRIVARTADVRDPDALGAALQEGVDELGRLDIVCANAGILTIVPATEMSDQVWKDTIDINLTGVWNTCKVAIPHLIAFGRGGSMVLTSSVAGVKGSANIGHYVAAKHGVVGLMRALAKELAPHAIRVNTVNPSIVPTGMMLNDQAYRVFRPDLETPTLDDARVAFADHLLLDIPWIEPADVSNAVLFLASDEGRYVTGSTFMVDAGVTV
jgi:SDR family mycofactocin-dependent oxidoreductase